MSLKLDALYSIKETATHVDMSERMLQMYAKKNNFQKIDNRYLFNGHQIKDLITKRNEKRTKKSISSNKVSEELNELRKDILIHKQKHNLLVSENEKLKTKLSKLLSENEDLKSKLSKKVPHQQQLRKAIELITLEAMKQGVQHKVFTDEEYNDLIGTISEVDFQKEQVQYLRSRVEKQDAILNKLVQQSADAIAEKRESNFIYAKEKGFDKK